VVEKARQARQELAEFRRRQGHPADTAADDEEQGGGDGGPVSPAQARTRKRRQAKQSERLELAAADNLSQLRLACIHPQVGRASGDGEERGAWLEFTVCDAVTWLGRCAGPTGSSASPERAVR
jgi:hypothetical protein